MLVRASRLVPISLLSMLPIVLAPIGKTLEDTVRPLKEEGVLRHGRLLDHRGHSPRFCHWSAISPLQRFLILALLSIAAWLDGPDVALVAQAVAEFPDKPVICEGRVHTPCPLAKAAMDAGAWAVVVGTAVTHPTSITSWFVEAVE